jgi:hypothetical protein
MASKHSTTEIPDNRALSDEERSLVGWMLEHGESRAPSFLPQLEQARVAARCHCGCASINFAIASQRAPNSGPMDILSDYVWQDSERHKFGAFVFARGGLLAGLDVYSVDGAVTPTWLPKPSQLRPLPFANTRGLTPM